MNTADCLMGFSAMLDFMNKDSFSIEMKVRDYECDMQGIVNNAIYQNYLEHARHEFLHSAGLSFAELTSRGVIVVVIRAELDYRQALRSGDDFRVSVSVRQVSRLKIVFDQQIIELSGGEPVLEAQITATSLNERGRPYFPEELKALL